MKNFFYLAIVLVFFVNCSTSSTVKDDVNTTNSSVTKVNSSASNQQTEANVETKTESEKVKLHDPMKMSKENFEIGKSKKGGDAEPIKAMPGSLTTAPDNSVISATMNAQGVPIETRAFKNNPMLDKVEKLLVGAKQTQIKVYLKNGKVVDLPQDKISNSSTASANEILTALGVIPKTAPQKNESKSAIEKSEQ